SGAYRFSRSLFVAPRWRLAFRCRLRGPQKRWPRFAVSLKGLTGVEVPAPAGKRAMDRERKRQPCGLRGNVGMPGFFSTRFEARAVVLDSRESSMGSRRA